MLNTIESVGERGLVSFYLFYILLFFIFLVCLELAKFKLGV